jgi:hypothetical protein
MSSKKNLNQARMTITNGINLSLKIPINGRLLRFPILKCKTKINGEVLNSLTNGTKLTHKMLVIGQLLKKTTNRINKIKKIGESGINKINGMNLIQLTMVIGPM